MTNPTHSRSLRGRLRILVALGVTSLALVVASPANAIYRGYEAPLDEAPVTERVVKNDNKTPPVDEDGKKSCFYKDDYHPHGTTATITKGNPDGSASTYTHRCDDGTWKQVSLSPTDSGYYWDGSDGSYYAQP